MCGRYVFENNTDLAEIERICREIQHNSQQDADYGTREIYPTAAAPIIALKNGTAKLDIMKWGFPNPFGKGVIINARSETVSSKKMFSDSFSGKRCVIPSTGFYEWRRAESGKITEKFIIKCKYNPMLYMAGVYGFHKNGPGYVILTRDANKYISDLHDRMPVILFESELLDWLVDDKFASLVLQRDDVILEKEIC